MQTPTEFHHLGLTFEPSPARAVRSAPAMAFEAGDGVVAYAALEATFLRSSDEALSARERWELLTTSWQRITLALARLESLHEVWWVVTRRRTVGEDGAILRLGWVAVGRGASRAEAGAIAARTLRDQQTIVGSTMSSLDLRPVTDAETLFDLLRALGAAHAQTLRRARWEPTIAIERAAGAGPTVWPELKRPAGVLPPSNAACAPWEPLVLALAVSTAWSGFVVRVVAGVPVPPEVLRMAEDDLRSVQDTLDVLADERTRDVAAVVDPATLVHWANRRIETLRGPCLAADFVLLGDDPIGAGVLAIAAAGVGASGEPSWALPRNARPVEVAATPPLVRCALAVSALRAALPLTTSPELFIGELEATSLVRTVEPPADEDSPLPCSRSRSIPLRFAGTEGIVLGDASGRAGSLPVHLREETRFQHTYVVGQTGTGKSTFLLNLIMQDIAAGHGVTVLDAHGTLVDDILRRVPAGRAGDLVLIDPSNRAFATPLNPLAIRTSDAIDYQMSRDRALDGLMDIFDKLYDLRTTGGPMFERYFRSFMLLTMGSSQRAYTPILPMLELALSDRAVRTQLMEAAMKEDPLTHAQVEAAIEANGEASLANMVPYVTSKLGRFYTPVIPRSMLCQPGCIDFAEVLSSRKIVLFSLNGAQLGRDTAALLGRVVMDGLAGAAMARGARPENPAHFIYVDEFQNFATERFATMLSELRKFRLGLVLSHQYTSQLRHKGEAPVLEAVLGNVGTMVAFRMGLADAELLEPAMAPRVLRQDIAGLPDRVAYVRSMGELQGRPFTLRTRPAPAEVRSEATALRREGLARWGTPFAQVEPRIAGVLSELRTGRREGVRRVGSKTWG